MWYKITNPNPPPPPDDWIPYETGVYSYYTNSACTENPYVFDITFDECYESFGDYRKYILLNEDTVFH